MSERSVVHPTLGISAVHQGGLFEETGGRIAPEQATETATQPCQKS